MAAAVRRAAERVDASRVPTALTLLGIAFVACLMPAQNDTWWQLRAGEVMWRTHHIMMRDEFSHTVNGVYWPNHEWLTQVVFYGLYRAGGLPLLTGCCAATVVATWALVLSSTRGSILARLLLVGTGAAFSTSAWSLRPQTITLFFLAATLWILVRQRGVWGLPLLFLVWANMHGGVAAGGLLLAAAVLSALAVERRRAPRLLLVSALCLLATAATPLGYTLWFEVPRSLARLRAYNILEWRGASLTRAGDWPFWIMLAGFAWVAVTNRRRWRSWEVSTLTLGTVLMAMLAVSSVRNIGLFAICAVPAVSWLRSPGPSQDRRTSEWTAKELSIVGTAAAIVVAVVGRYWMAPAGRLQWHPLPQQALAAISRCDGPLYNRYDEGGYIIWFLEGRRVFIDSRQDPFPEAFVHRQFEIEANGNYEATFAQFGIRCALTEQHSALSRRLRQNGWQPHLTGTLLLLYSAPGRQ